MSNYASLLTRNNSNAWNMSMRLRFNVPFRLCKPLGTRLAVQYRVSVHHRIDILIAKLLLTMRLHCALLWRQLRPKGQASYKLHWSYYPKVKILSPLLMTEISACRQQLMPKAAPNTENLRSPVWNHFRWDTINQVATCARQLKHNLFSLALLVGRSVLGRVHFEKWTRPSTANWYCGLEDCRLYTAVRRHRLV